MLNFKSQGMALKKIVTRLKMLISTIREILKKFKATGTVKNVPRRAMFIFPPRKRKEKKQKKSPRITVEKMIEESSILGSSSLQNYH